MSCLIVHLKKAINRINYERKYKKILAEKEILIAKLNDKDKQLERYKRIVEELREERRRYDEEKRRKTNNGISKKH